MKNKTVKQLVFAMAVCAAALAGRADTEVVDGIEWTYTVSDGEASVGSGSSGSPAVPKQTIGAITIPSTLDGRPVTSIGAHAFRDCSRINSVTIPEGVTSIGKYAFECCSGLTSVTIPSSVTSIGDGAFWGCSGLTSVTIPSSVMSIGNGAFGWCRRLMSFDVDAGNSNYKSVNGLLLSKDGKTLISGINGNVIVPEGVTSIGDDAFAGCSGLKSVTIPSSVMSIGHYAFRDCSGLGDGIVIVDNCVLTVNGACPTLVVMPEGTRLIADSAFEGCSGLKSVTIPSSVTSIGYHVFAYCSGLTNVTMPSSVTSVGSYAFAECSGLTNVTIPSSVTSIGNWAFWDCSGLTNVVFGGNAPTCMYSPFYGVKSGCTAMVYNGTTGWGSSGTWQGLTLKFVDRPQLAFTASGYEGAYDGMGHGIIVNVTDPAEGAVVTYSRTEDGDYAETPILFTNVTDGAQSVYFKITADGYAPTSGVATVTITPKPDGGPYTEVVGETEWTYTVSGGKASIGDIYYHSPAIPQSTTGAITIPSTIGGNPVTGIGSSAFYGCSGLTSVTIPSSVTSIDYRAFCGCSGLTSVTIPKGVTSIGSSAFEGCSGLTSVTIPSSVTRIGDNTFQGCGGMMSFDVDAGNPNYKSFNGLLLSKDGKTLISGINGNVIVPEGVTSIGGYAFYERSGLTSVTIPNGVTSIGWEAFYGCSGLTGVTIPSSVTSIGERAFCACSGLTGVTIPSSVTSIDWGVFAECSGLTNVTIPSSVTSIDASMFWCCSGLKSVTIPSSVTSIGQEAFYKCSGLTSVTIPNSVTSIGGLAFYGCSGLTSVTIPSSVTNIEDSAFRDCSGLTNVTIPEGVTSIWNGAFEGCSGLTSVTIPSSVTSIGYNSFSDCSGLTNVVFGGNAPTCNGFTFSAVKNGCTATVKWGTTGWGSSGTWWGLTLKYVDKPIAFTSSGYEGAYDGMGHGITVTVTDPAEGAVVTYSLTEDGDYAETPILFTNAMDGVQSVYFKITADGYAPTSGVATVCITAKPIQDAIDRDLGEMRSGGSADWRWGFADGNGYLVSGSFTGKGESWMELVVTNDAKVAFDCKASTLRLNGKTVNTFKCFTNGVEVLAMDGNTDWQYSAWEVPAGTVIRWVYSQVATYGSDYENCGWVRNLAVCPKVTVSFAAGEEITGKLPSDLCLYTDETAALPDDEGFGYACHTFVGWTDGETTYAPGTAYDGTNGGVTLSAVWTANTLTPPNIGAQETYAALAQSVTLTDDNDGATLYYSVNGSPFAAYAGAFDVAGEAAIRAYAAKDNYFNSTTNEIAVARQQYAVTFAAGAYGSITDGETIQQVRYGDDAAPVAVTADKWHNFTGWDGATTGITSARDLTAQYAPKTFALDFGGEEFDWQCGDELIGPTPTLAKHRLAYWTYQGTNYVAGSVLPFDGEDTSYTAVWEEVHYASPVLVAPSVYAATSCEVSATAQDGATIYCQVGEGDWFAYENPFEVSGEAVIRAYASGEDCFDSATNEIAVARQQYAVTFAAGAYGSIAGVEAVQQVRYGDDAAPVAVAADKWHNFTGWDGATTGITSARDLTAQYAPKTFTLDFGGAEFDWQYGDELIGPRPTLAKHRLAYWSYQGTNYVAGSVLPFDGEDTRYTAVWEEVYYASPVLAAPGVYAATSCEVSATAQDGATIYCQVGEGDWFAYESPFEVSGEAVIRAYASGADCFDSATNEIAVARQQYAVTFAAGAYGSITDGETLQQVRYGDDAVPVTVAADKWHNFTGWDGVTTGITSARDLTAQYTPKTFTLDFGGEEVDWQYGDELIGPTPTLAKHRLAYWSYQGTNYVAGSVLPFDGEDVNYTAVWEEKRLAAPVIDMPDTYDGERCTATVTAQEGATIRCKIGDGAWFDYSGAFDVVGSATVTAYAVQDDWYDSDCAVRATVRGPWTFGEYLGASNVVFTSSGDGEWRRTNEVGGVAGYYLACGDMRDNETGTLSATFHGKGTIRFRFRASVESWPDIMDFDYFVFADNGEEVASWSGETGWQEAAFELTGGGEHVVSWSYVKDEGDTFEADFDNCVWLDSVTWTAEGPTVTDDPGAMVTGDAASGYTVKPSEGKKIVEVTIPAGVAAEKVTVEVGTDVETVKPNGAKVKVVKGTHDITGYLDIPAADAGGNVDLTKAAVKEAVVKEALDPKKGAEITLDPSNVKLQTSNTKPGLTYTFSEGTTVKGLTQKSSKVGDGSAWTPKVIVKGGASGFYSIGVKK